MNSIVETTSDNLVCCVPNLSIEDKDETSETCENVCGGAEGICAICLDIIDLKETALIKGCEHAYCVTCILRWVTYVKKPTCPQCKNPFDFLNIHRALDGSIRDYMFEESVCLLLRAPWFKPLCLADHEECADETDSFNLDMPEYELDYDYEDEDEDDLDDVYASSAGNLRIGNRRWGDNGFVRAGRQEARPVHVGPSSSSEPRGKNRTGRRAKRTLKREAATRAAAEKHEQQLARLAR